MKTDVLNTFTTQYECDSEFGPIVSEVHVLKSSLLSQKIFMNYTPFTLIEVYFIEVVVVLAGKA